MTIKYFSLKDNNIKVINKQDDYGMESKQNGTIKIPNYDIHNNNMTELHKFSQSKASHTTLHLI